MLRLNFKFVLCFILGMGSASTSLGQTTDSTVDTLVPTENLVVEGIPPIPKSLVAEVGRYTESRSAGFVDWHPTERQMLIATRFGNTPQIHQVKMPGGARTQLTFFAEPVGSASFEPRTGEYFIFSRDAGGNEFGQLYRHDLRDGKVTLLTDGGRSQNGGPIWNRAKDKFMYASTRRNGADRDLWMMDPREPQSSRPIAELTGGGWGGMDWSLDDSQVIAMEYLSVNRSNLWLIDVATGKREPLNDLDETVAYGTAAFSILDNGLYLTSDEKGEFQRLYWMDLKTKESVCLTEDINWDVDGFELSPDGKWLAFVTNEAGASKAYLMETKTRNYEPIAGLPQGLIGGGRWHPTRSEIAFTVSSSRSTSDVYSYDVADRKVERWTESELGGLVANELSEPELIRWTSFDGLEISGFMYPSAKRFSGKRPVMIDIHGGPEGQSRPGFQGRNNYFLNELGIVIIYPNVRGSTGFGKTFVTLDNGLKREDSVKDIGALLDWIEKQPGLDSDRVMVTGGSYGGYMTLACAVHYNDRIRCSLDIVGISHFGTFLKNTESYRRDLRRVEYGDERVPEIAELFERISPLNNAEKIKKPLFVVQGGNDPRVPLSEAEQMVAKVKANQGPVWYLMAKDEGHGFRKKGNADFEFYATIMFVNEYLLGDK
jgi:dipeptidyl aminopeptidase/acylaminoacyl peptidase